MVQKMVDSDQMWGQTDCRALTGGKSI